MKELISGAGSQKLQGPQNIRVIRERWLEQIPERRPRASVLAAHAGRDIAALLGEIERLRRALSYQPCKCRDNLGMSELQVCSRCKALGEVS